MQNRTWRSAHILALSTLVALGRHTISGLLTASGQQFTDWSAAYRLFSKARFNISSLLAPLRRTVIELLDEDKPLVAIMDDTILRKRGRKIAGTGWRRDPLGPPFCSNFIWAQRFLQISAALPEGPGPSRARAIPIDMLHCPSPRKPRKKAPEPQWIEYRRQAKASRISVRGAKRVNLLRAELDGDGQLNRHLIVAADGTYTNQAMLRNLPDRTTFIGRIRKDAKLYALPIQDGGLVRGRQRIYGAPCPTPQQLRQDESIPWQTTRAFLAGQQVNIEFKAVKLLRWRASGRLDLLLVIIRPLAYRPAKGRHLLYRDPVYLICSDPELPLPQLVQSYLWRWEIEVGFRDQKNLLGSGQAQVRTPASVERVPALIAAAYGFLHLAVAKVALGGKGLPILPLPRWQPFQEGKRCSTQQVINALRVELWGQALGVGNFSDFVSKQKALAKSEKFPNDPASALLYATE